VIALLPFIEGYWPKLICFVIFIVAAVSDVFDGWLARSRKQVTDIGILLDPIADKLLLFSTLIPIYWISRQRHDLYDIPLWGSIPLWVCLLLIGRELAMTGFRWWAKRQGVIIPAGGAGKLKTVIQNIFIGATIAWFAFRDARKPLGWEHSRFADYWNEFHGSFVAVTLAVAALLTVYSFAVYIYRNRSLFSARAR
jgi:CDP-diacylglycerol---glycerol-3-phosphate 3-phosphatidyltransferase